MMHYYETAHRETGDEFETLTAHDTLEEAIKFAEAHEIPTIQEIGGSWDEYEKCWFCGDWFTSSEMNTENTCERCQMAIWSHEGNGG